jgi:hypothetical protein
MSWPKSFIWAKILSCNLLNLRSFWGRDGKTEFGHEANADAQNDSPTAAGN